MISLSPLHIHNLAYLAEWEGITGTPFVTSTPASSRYDTISRKHNIVYTLHRCFYIKENCTLKRLNKRNRFYFNFGKTHHRPVIFEGT